VQNHTIGKKIGGKSAIEHKDGVKGRKKIGCKITQKKRGGKVQLNSRQVQTKNFSRKLKQQLGQHE